MRFSILASVLSLLALGAMVASPGPATAAKSKMGCDTETEMWNAAAGKCEPGARQIQAQVSRPAAGEDCRRQEGPRRQKGAGRQEGAAAAK